MLGQGNTRTDNQMDYIESSLNRMDCEDDTEVLPTDSAMTNSELIVEDISPTDDEIVERATFFC